MLQPIERVNNSNDENSFQDAEDYIEASFNAPEHTADEQPEHYTSNINDAEIDRLSSLSDDDIYDWDVPEHVPAGSDVPDLLTVAEMAKLDKDAPTKAINNGGDLHHAKPKKPVRLALNGSPLRPANYIAPTMEQLRASQVKLDSKGRAIPRKNSDEKARNLSMMLSGTTEEFTTAGVQPFLLLSVLARYSDEDFDASHDMTLANDVCDFKYQMKERLLTGQVSIIEAVNAAYSWTDILEHYGYKCIPLNGYGSLKLGWVPPESLEDPEIDSDTPTVFLMPADDDNLPDKTPMRYFSLGGKDICGLEFEHLDKFDFLCIREFGGNQYEALLSLTNEFLEIKEHNRLVFNKIRGGV